MIVPITLSLLTHPTEEIRILSSNVTLLFRPFLTREYFDTVVRGRMEEVVGMEGNEVVRKTIIKDYWGMCER